MEIGSIYEIDPETFSDAAAYDSSAFTLEEIKKYNKNHTAFTGSGREAIALALKAIAKNRPGIKKCALLPAYMCDSVFWPFERAGWDLHFYPIDKNLEAEKETLSAQIKTLKPGLLFIHPYYGLDTCKPLRSMLKIWQSKGLCIMEDVTQSYYLNNIEWNADYIIGSLRKWYPVPDGGFAVSNEPFPEEFCLENRIFIETKLSLLTKKWDYFQTPGSPKEKQEQKSAFMAKNREMEEWLDSYEKISPLSNESMKILSGIKEERYRNRRNENYRYLFQQINVERKALSVTDFEFTPVFAKESAPEAVDAPLYFPVYAKNREDLQKFLVSRGIYAPVLWPVGKENETILSETEQEIYRQILALPIDQRYGLSEMQYIARALAEYEGPKAISSVACCPDSTCRPAPSCSFGSACPPLQGQDIESEVIGIRADANATIATGHIMRCITIAKQLWKKGKKVLFFTADEYPGEILTQNGMEYVCLHTSWEQMEEELPHLSRELKKHNCQKLLVDSYQVTENYFNSLRKICKTIYIDDCFTALYPADLIINYNPYHVRFPYKEAYKGKSKLLLGTAYVPLREEFQAPSCAPSRIADTTKHVLISCGGGDIYNVLCGILSKAVNKKELASCTFHVIVGSFNQNAAELELLAKEHSNILLHHNVNNMAELMSQCQIAVSAAGTMLFELCAMQLPTVFYVCADNQQYDSDFFAAESRMLFSGDIRQNRKESIDKILQNMILLLNDEPMRQQMKQKLHEVTDGKGAKRIAEEIINL